MKKLLLTAIVFFGLQGYAQKTFEVYNFTSQTVRISEIVTNASGTNFPEFRSLAAPIMIPPSGSYILQNPAHPTRFPFHSPSSSPYIPNWQILTPPSSTIVASNTAWTLGSAQVFYKMAFNVGAGGGGINTTNTSGNPVTGPGFTAEYSEYIAPAPSTVIIYTIIIY